MEAGALEIAPMEFGASEWSKTTKWDGSPGSPHRYHLGCCHLNELETLPASNQFLLWCPNQNQKVKCQGSRLSSLLSLSDSSEGLEILEVSSLAGHHLAANWNLLSLL